MLYIVTYATHSERYFETLKESCPDIVVLGYGTKWNGFMDKAKGVSDFCRTLKPDDIVCFVDGFDSVILDRSKIEERYLELGHPLVMSTEPDPKGIWKYYTDKVYSSCEGTRRINSGMYIGYPQNIIDLWSDMEEGDDDQRHAIKKCEKFYVDVDNVLFYNYDKNEQSKGGMAPIISAPGGKNMDHILKDFNYNTKVGQTDMNKYAFRAVKSFTTIMLPEIIWLFLSIILFLLVPDKKIAVAISSVVFFSIVHFAVYTNHKKDTNKILYTLGDILYLTLIACAFFAKTFRISSVLLLIALSLPNITIDNRIKYLFDDNSPYKNQGNIIDKNKIVILGIIFKYLYTSRCCT